MLFACSHSHPLILLHTHTHARHPEKNNTIRKITDESQKLHAYRLRIKGYTVVKKKSIRETRKVFRALIRSTNSFTWQHFNTGFSIWNLQCRSVSLSLCLKAKSPLSRTKTNNPLDVKLSQTHRRWSPFRWMREKTTTRRNKLFVHTHGNKKYQRKFLSKNVK